MGYKNNEIMNQPTTNRKKRSKSESQNDHNKNVWIFDYPSVDVWHVKECVFVTQ